MAAPAKNPFTWVEIYVDDMNRAKAFYESVLKVSLIDMQMPEEFGQMVSFPWAEGKENISGALVKMDSMKPGTGGTMVYFTCDDCAVEEGRVKAAGGEVLQPKMSLGEHGFCSIVQDTEGNTIGLHSRA
ncbi:MAG: VOC family protein [Bacteroidetes bacterium]|nr:VOC family protein [Bacteroidota bacterium]